MNLVNPKAIQVKKVIIKKIKKKTVLKVQKVAQVNLVVHQKLRVIKRVKRVIKKGKEKIKKLKKLK